MVEMIQQSCNLLPFLYIIKGGGGGGVNILYHNILTPHPIKKKCQPQNSIVCDMKMFCVMKLSCHWIPFTKYHSCIFVGGGGGSISYTIIF